MAISAGLVRPVAQIQAGTTPKIYTVTLTLADTEYSQALSSGVKILTVSARRSPIKIYFQTGSPDYLSIEANASYSENGLNYSGSIFLQSPKAGTVVEIVEWT